MILGVIIFLMTLLILYTYKYNFSENIFEINRNPNVKKYPNGIIIIDNFYKYPNKVRKHAIGKTFTPHLTLYKTMFYDPNMNIAKSAKIIKHLENIEGNKINKKNWNANTKKESNGYFQYLTKNDNPVIHSDGTLRSMIVYLKKNPTKKSGTCFYKHKLSGVYKESYADKKIVDSDLKDFQKWDQYFSCSNKFNRAIIFDGVMYHASQGGFGSNKFNARLYQTFFYTFE